MVYFPISDQCPKTVGDLSIPNTTQSSGDPKVDNVFIMKNPSKCTGKLFGINLIADGNGTITLAFYKEGSQVAAKNHDVTTGLNIIVFDKPQEGDTVAIKASNAVIIPGNGNSETILYPNSDVVKGSSDLFEKKTSHSVNTTFNVIGIFQGMHL